MLWRLSHWKGSFCQRLSRNKCTSSVAIIGIVDINDCLRGDYDYAKFTANRSQKLSAWRGVLRAVTVSYFCVVNKSVFQWLWCFYINIAMINCFTANY